MKRAVAWLMGGVFSLALCGPLAFGQEPVPGEAVPGKIRISDAAPPVSEQPSAGLPYELPGQQPAYYGDGSNPYGGGGQAPLYRPMQTDQLFHAQYRLDTRTSNTYGYGSGYTSLSAFLPYLADPNTVFFLDGRGLVTYEGAALGANLGVGVRFYDETINRIFGLSGWLDYDPGHIKTYQQAGISFESLGKYFDMRLNGYVPLGTDRNVLSSFITGNPYFTGNRINLTRQLETESAFTGFDAEIGGPTPFLGRYGINAYAGFYFFTASGVGDLTGASGRISAQVNEDVSLGFTVTGDRKFGTNIQGQIVLTLPDGKSSNWFRPLSVYDRLVQPVNRNYRVTAHHHYETLAEAALTTKDNSPYFVVHINPNTGSATGNGTIESPYASLAQYNALPLGTRQDTDIIYVAPQLTGDALNPVAADSNGVTLYSCQRLLSTSLAHNFTAVQGTFVLPRTDLFASDGATSDPLPILRNGTGGNVVTIADTAHTVEVSGFNIQGSPTGSGIRGSNNQFVNINRNTITGSQYGIRLDNLTGTTAANLATTITGNTISGSVLDGINITNSAVAPLDVTITQNTVTANGGNGLRVSADAGTLITTNISNNSFNANQQNGLLFEATNASTLQGNILNNQFSTNILNGIFMTSNASSLHFGNALAGYQIRGNTINSNALTGLRVDSTNGSLIELIAAANTFGNSAIIASGNGDDGIRISADSGTVDAVIGGSTLADGNSLVGNVENGIVLNLTGTAVGRTQIDFNTITLSGTGTGGSILLTGHDVDFHSGQNGFDTVILNYLRGATAAANYDIAVIGSGAGFWSFTGGTQVKAGFGTTTFFDTAALAANPALWDQVFANDVVMINSHDSVGGGNLNDAGVATIVSQQSRFIQAINSGVDIWANSGATNPDYYNFLPSSVLATGASIGAINGFTATPQGAAIGITDPMINGFPTHNRFASSAPQFTVLETLGTENITIGVQNATLTAGGFGGSNGDGVRLNVANTARLTTSTVSNNTIQGYGDNGIHVRGSNNGQIENLTVAGNRLTNNGNGIHIERTDSALINASIRANVTVVGTTFGNTDAGLRVSSSGSALPTMSILSEDNDFRSNATGIAVDTRDFATVNFVSNRDQLSGSTGDNVSFNTQDSSVVNAFFSNFTSESAGGNGFNFATSGTSRLNATLNSPFDPTLAARSSVTGNALNGILGRTSDQGVLTLNIDATDINENGPTGSTNSNTTAGLNLNRVGASLFTVNVSNSSISNNTGDGIQLELSGSDAAGVIAPFTGSPNRLNLTNTLVNGNGRDGISTRGWDAGVGGALNVPTSLITGQASIVLNATNSSFSNNGLNGVVIDVLGPASFGNTITGERSIFDGVTITGNGASSSAANLNANNNDGINIYLFGSQTSRATALIEVNSNSGNTLISNNRGDGIHANTPFGVLDLIVQGDANPALPNFVTQLSRNAGSGIQIDVSDSITDAEDPERGGTLNFVPGSTGEAGRVTVNVDNVILGGNTAADGNGQDGFFLNAQDNQRGFGSLSNISVTNSLVRFNARHGVNLRGDGTQTDLSSTSLMNATVNGNRIADNTVNGLNIDLDGQWGSYDLFTNQRTSANQFIVNNNLVESNGRNGVSYIANAGVVSRFAWNVAGRSNFIQVGFEDPQPTNPAGIFNPANIALQAPFYNADFTGIADQYLNLSTSLNSTMQFYGNTVRFNGNNAPVVGQVVPPPEGHGFLSKVGTNTYLGLDMGGVAGNAATGNAFSGNATTDVAFRSLTSGTATRDPVTGLPTLFADNEPNASVAANAANQVNEDRIFLDDTAQMDLRFNNNSGNSLLATGPRPQILGAANGGFGGEQDLGAYYNNPDQFKSGTAVPDALRFVQLFQVDDSFNLNTNNTFVQGGAPFDVFTTLNNGSFFMRTLADPAFPNIGFAENWTTDPGHPWLP